MQIPSRHDWLLRAGLVPLVAALSLAGSPTHSRPASSLTLHVPVLMYHYIRVNPVATDTLGFSLSVTPSDFNAQMSYLYSHGAHSVTFDEVYGAIDNGTSLPSNPVILTFDDGYADFATTAVPILQQYGFVGVDYAVSGFIGHSNYMTMDQLHHVVAAGMTIGAHTVNHPYLARLSSGNQWGEISTSRAQLQQWTGQPINDFAYPNGSYNATTISLVQKAGFREATTTIGGISESASNRFALPRVRVSGGEGLGAFASSVGPMTGAAPPDQVVASGNLDRYYQPGVGHWVTSGGVTSSWVGGNPGFEEQPLGSVFATGGAGLQAIYSCQAGPVHFLSLGSGCEGRTVLELDGYSYTSSQPGTIQIFRCRVAGTNDHFVSLGANCEGQVNEGSLGFISSLVKLVRIYNGSVHGATTGVAPPGFRVEQTLGELSSVGPVPIYKCRLGNSQSRFSSLDSGCEHQRKIGMSGFAIASADGGGDAGLIALTRCYLPANGDHFDTTTWNCEGAPGAQNDGILGYIYPPSS